MSRLLVLTTSELAVGYRLAGATTVEVRSAAETRAILEELLDREDGIIAVHAPYFNALPSAAAAAARLAAHPARRGAACGHAHRSDR